MKIIKFQHYNEAMVIEKNNSEVIKNNKDDVDAEFCNETTKMSNSQVNDLVRDLDLPIYKSELFVSIENNLKSRTAAQIQHLSFGCICNGDEGNV